MVRITNYLLKRSSSKTCRPAKDDEKSFIQQLTHLYLQEKNITVIDNLDLCTDLLALYLYDNKIQKIENLDHLDRLTVLYLHNNEIQDIENLDSLHNLKCLKLGMNKISIVRGLEGLTKLEELWLESQALPKGATLIFDPPSIFAISQSLKFLNVSNNGLTSLRDLANLRRLEQLYAENNQIDSLQDLVDCVANWNRLVEFKVRGNSVCRARKWRDNIVVYCPALRQLDGFTVSDGYREFLHNWRMLAEEDAEGDGHKRNKFLAPFLKARPIAPSPRVAVPSSSAPHLSHFEHKRSRKRSNEKAKSNFTATLML